MASPFVYFKIPEQDTTILTDITTSIMAGETITAITASTPSPGSPDPLTYTITSGLSPQVTASLSAGDDGMSYGVTLTVTTTARVFLVSLAIVAQDPSFVPYTTSNPEAFQDLVDQIEAGKAAVGTAVFVFPPSVDASRGFIVWELMASDGTIYSAGNAFEYQQTQNGLANIVTAKSVVTVPSNIPPNLDGTRYQLRYTLSLPQAIGTPVDPLTGTPGQNMFYQYESLRVVGLNTVPLGVQPSVELQGVPATISIVVDKIYDNVTVELWADGTQVAAPAQISDYQQTANGWVYSGVISTSQLMVSVAPYTLIWKYWTSTNSAEVFQESADFFVINASLMTAVTDVKAKINKARTTLYGTPDLLYPNATVLTWLRRGGDAFNGAYGQFTNFTFTNALGPIREFWLLEAELAAIQSQYLAEGEKAFNFQGAAISLDVDRTQYLDTAAAAIQNRFDQELKAIKTNLIIKGNTTGDGSANPTALQRGAIGAVGITITPASMWGRYSPGYGLGGLKTF